jgi:hypothetical protein
MLCNASGRLQVAFQQALTGFLTCPALERVKRSDITVAHYMSFLQEVYCYTRENPQLQAYATAYFRGPERKLVKAFLRHAASEIGHDQLALDDIKALGGDISDIPRRKPLPATAAMNAYSDWTIIFRGAPSYLGWLYFLEHMPTTAGGGLIEAIEKCGVPRSAMTFISDHVSIDQAHVRLMDDYVSTLLQTERELDEVIYAMRVTSTLYGQMVASAFERADRPEQFDFGIDVGEHTRSATIDVMAAE